MKATGFSKSWLGSERGGFLDPQSLQEHTERKHRTSQVSSNDWLYRNWPKSIYIQKNQALSWRLDETVEQISSWAMVESGTASLLPLTIKETVIVKVHKLTTLVLQNSLKLVSFRDKHRLVSTKDYLFEGCLNFVFYIVVRLVKSSWNRTAGWSSPILE